MVDRQLSYGRDVIEGFLREVSPIATLIDLGAGSGNDLATARKVSPGVRCFALESFPPNVARLVDQGVSVHAGNLERDRLPFDDEFFDVVMANQILEHLKEVFWVLHEVSRTLKVGGHFVLGVPNLASLHNRLLLLLGMQPTCIQNHSAHVRGYTRHDLVRLFDIVVPGGFQLARFAGANFYPLPPFAARPAARLLPNSAVTILLLFRKLRPYQGEFLEHPIKAQLETNFYLGERGKDFGHQM